MIQTFCGACEALIAVDCQGVAKAPGICFDHLLCGLDGDIYNVIQDLLPCLLPCARNGQQNIWHSAVLGMVEERDQHVWEVLLVSLEQKLLRFVSDLVQAG